MRFHTLEQWLEWQQTLHPRTIDLTLERVRRVLAALDLPHSAAPVVTVAGTNGKGSVVALLEAMLRAAGYSVGAFTSPHLVRYNERVRVNGCSVDDATLIDSFARIDAARGDVSLTYFEFNALAAFDCLARAHVDVQVLEVGLGGRLDAVNAIDADVAVVTTIGLDHCEWLGPDEESIGREKAGIFRAGRPAIYGARRMPDSIAAVAAASGARLRRLGVDFDFVERPDAWDFIAAGTTRRDLPLPALPGAVQLDNASTALAALAALEPAILVPDHAVRSGLAAVRLAGRFQVVPGPVEWILDVAHNPQAAQALAARLVARPLAGRTLFICGMLGDKDVQGVAAALSAVPGDWFAVGLDGPRALPPAELSARLRAVLKRPVQACPDVRAGLQLARQQARPGDRVVVFGSFLTVGPALQWLDLEAD